MRREITGFSNPLIKYARSLRDKKFRKRERKFLAEGLRIMTEGHEAGFLPDTLFISKDANAHPLTQQIEDAVLDNGGEVIETKNDILSKLSGKDNPQTILGIYNDISIPLADLKASDADIWLVAQAMRDPGNLGTMLRTGDAIGAGGLILIDDCTDPFSVEAVRASMGAIFTQNITQCSWDEFTQWRGNEDGQLVGTSLNTDTDYQAADYQSPCFILTGNESQGLPKDYEQQCDLLVKMPMMGKADSLNAAVATAVMSYEVLNQFRRR